MYTTKLKIALPVIFLLCILYCCKKGDEIQAVSSINIINAIPGTSIAAYFSDTTVPYYQLQSQIAYSSSISYAVPSGTDFLNIVPSEDTNKLAITGKFNLERGAIYSLYLFGGTHNIDTIFRRDTIPYYIDSMAGVRFVNLSGNDHPISIRLANSPNTGKEFPDLASKQVSPFKSYAAGVQSGGSYDFEILDNASGDILATYTWNVSPFKTNTLVVTGSKDPGNETPISVFSVNNY